MAQDFERTLTKDISNSDASPSTVRATANSNDAIVGIRCCNTSGSAVNVSVYVENTSVNYFIQKNAPVPAGGAIELIDGASKVVVQSGDTIKAYADTASAIDVIVSAVDAISA